MSSKSQTTIYIGATDPTPLGPIWIAVGEKGLLAVSMDVEKEIFVQELEDRHGGTIVHDETRTAEQTRQIWQYLHAERDHFDLPLDWSVMTPFQEKALRSTCAIPRGETRSYGEIAAQIGNPRAARAVGRAEATNPIPIVIPCHRVIGADGGMHGYGGPAGVDTKAWLLKLEGAL